MPAFGGVVAFTVTDVKPLQSLKTELPIFVTPFGIVTEVKPVQSAKAAVPISVTLSGIVMDVKPRQS